MENITLGQIGIAIAFIVALWSGYDFISKKVNAPLVRLQEQISDIQEQSDLTLQMCQKLILHDLTGDHVVDMQQLYDEVDDYRTKKAKKK